MYIKMENSKLHGEKLTIVKYDIVDKYTYYITT